MSLCTDQTERCPLEFLVNISFYDLGPFFLVFLFSRVCFALLNKIQHKHSWKFGGKSKSRSLGISFGGLTLFFVVVVLLVPNQ